VAGLTFANTSGGRHALYRDPRLNKSDSTALDRRMADADNNCDVATRKAVTAFAPLSPHSIDER
jgi:hypothetical protein